MSTSTIENPKIVSRAEWLAARKQLLAREKQLTRERDAIAAERRSIPWVKVEKQYVFDSPSGKKTLADLFEGRSQLIVYPSCSARIGRRIAPVALSSWIITMAPWCTWRNATSLAQRFHGRHCPRSKPSSSAWADGLPGCPPTEPTSTTTIAFRSPRKK
jgi:predicted dithiol-disulfide oxidoreductase (DUF899 family)